MNFFSDLFRLLELESIKEQIEEREANATNAIILAGSGVAMLLLDLAQENQSLVRHAILSSRFSIFLVFSVPSI